MDNRKLDELSEDERKVVIDEAMREMGEIFRRCEEAIEHLDGQSENWGDVAIVDLLALERMAQEYGLFVTRRKGRKSKRGRKPMPDDEAIDLLRKFDARPKGMTLEEFCYKEHTSLKTLERIRDRFALKGS